MSNEKDTGGSLSRREFVASSALTTAGVAAGLSYYFSRPKAPDLSELEKEENLVRMGFIGVGNRGSSLLRTALQVAGTRPIAICDKRLATAKDRKKDVLERRVKNELKKQGVKWEDTMGEKLPSGEVARAELAKLREQLTTEAAQKVKTYDDYRRVLDDKDVECVVIATPHYLHGQMALDAVQAGKHVYCEKAMAFTIGENQDICNLMQGGPENDQGHKVVFQVGHQRRYSPLYQRVISMVRPRLEEGEYAGDHVGDVTAIRAQWNRNDEIRRPCADPELERIINWRLYQEYSGGLTTEFASHQIDIVNWLLDTHPESVCGVGGVDFYTDGRDTHDNIHLIFTYRVPTWKRDPYGRVEMENGQPVQAKDRSGRPLSHEVSFDYMSIMTNDHLRFSEMILGRYGSIAVTLGGGEFYKEKKAREDPNRIAEGTNPRRAKQKKILRSGATVVASSGIACQRGDPIDEVLTADQEWTQFIEPIQGAYDRVETLLAMESYIKCVRLSRAGKPFDQELRASAQVGMRGAVPALMANIAMREQRTVRWSEFFSQPT